jgi:hypothetical protein
VIDLDLGMSQHKYHMQIKHYTILDAADLDEITAWAADPYHGCYIISQGREGHVTHSLCVHTPPNNPERFTEVEAALAGMIVETAWPE